MGHALATAKYGSYEKYLEAYEAYLATVAEEEKGKFQYGSIEKLARERGRS